MKLKTNNLNGFNHVLTKRAFNERAVLTFALYEKELPSIWALQEIPTGGSGQSCIKQLQNLASQHGYKMILPDKTWKISDHPRSIQSVLLLRGAQNIDVLKLDERIELFNRYNYVRVTFDGVKEYYILNIHAPQTELFSGHAADDGYVRQRKHLAKQFYEVLKTEVKKLLADGKRAILMGDFNKNLEQQEMKELTFLGLCNVTGENDNTHFCGDNNAEDLVDHILVSKNIVNEAGQTKCSVDTDFVKVQKLSDHATVTLDIAI